MANNLELRVQPEIKAFMAWEVPWSGVKKLLFRNDAIFQGRRQTCCCLMESRFARTAYCSQRPRQQRETCGWCLLQAVRSGEMIDEAFLSQLQEALHSKALVLLGDFNQPSICWKSNAGSCRQSRRSWSAWRITFQPGKWQSYQRRCDTGPDCHQLKQAHCWRQDWRQPGLKT